MNKIDLSALPDPELDAQFYAGVPFKRLLAWVFDVIAIILLSSAAILSSRLASRQQYSRYLYLQSIWHTASICSKTILPRVV